MPRYFFHLYNRIGEALDPEGRELSDLEAARLVAVEEIRAMLGEEVAQGLLDLRGYIEIADEGGQVLDVVRFEEAIEVRHRGLQ